VHVLCEKPMALSLDECDLMIRAADKTQKNLLIGHCIRFWPEYAKTTRIIASGEYGQVVAASFRRLSSSPNWSKDDWLASEEHSGGVALDLHIHDTDYIQHIFGPPTGVISSGAKSSSGAMNHIFTKYVFGQGPVVTAEGSWAMASSFDFEMSFNIILEKATIAYDNTRDPAFQIYPDNGNSFTPEVVKGDGYSCEIDHFMRMLKGENPAQVINLYQSKDAVRIVEGEKKSIVSGGVFIQA